MQPFEVDGIDRVLLALEPVARDLRDGYLLEAARVIPVPVGQQRRRLGPQVNPKEAGFLLYLVRLDANLVPETTLRMQCLLKRLMKASAGVVEQPAVVIAAQAALLDEAVRQVRAPVRAVLVDEPVVPALIAVQSQVLAQDAHRLHGLLAELRRTRDGMPVTPQQFSHRSRRTCLA